MPDYNADDIYLLYNMINKPVLKENVNKLMTKGDFFLRLNTKEINIHSSISRLLRAGFIRENTPKEFLKYLTVSDIKQLLNRKNNLTKDLLILEAELTVSDEDIKKHSKYMTFYIVSDLGNEILEKYKNLILFFKKSDKIFGYLEINGRFNASYFFKNYTHDPLNEIFNYYKDKNPEIAGRVCYIKEEYDTSISYAIQSISKMLMTRIDGMVESSYFFNNFDLRRIYYDSWIVETYSRMELNEDTLKDLIKHEYNQHFKFADLLSYELFEKIQLAVMNNESEAMVKVSSKVGQLIFDKYFSESNNIDSNKSDDRESFIKIEEYYKKTAKELALLDLLISHLDLELLYGLRDRVDIMINEWDRTLAVEEETSFEEK